MHQAICATGCGGVQLQGDHAAKAPHLTLGQLVLGMGSQPRVTHPAHLGLGLQPGGQLAGVGAVALHTDI